MLTSVYVWLSQALAELSNILVHFDLVHLYKDPCMGWFNPSLYPLSSSVKKNVKIFSSIDKVIVRKECSFENKSISINLHFEEM